MADGTKYGDLSDEELIHAMREGKENALREFYKRKSKKFLFYVYDIVADRHTAGTIVHDAFIAIWELKAELITISDWEALLYTICRHKATDSNRAKYTLKNRVHLTEELRQFVYDIDDSDTLANQINRAEIYNEILVAINALAPRQHQVVKYLLKDKTNKEIGELMGITTITVRRTRDIAVANIKEHLKAKRLLPILILIGIYCEILMIFNHIRFL